MGSSEYLMKVQNLSNVETAGISQPQTLTQKLRYELQAQQEQELDALQDKLGELYSSIEGAESAKYLTYNVESSKAYNKHEPKRITMDAAEKLFLEHKSQLKLLSDKSPKQKAESSDVSNGKNSQTKKKTRKILCENLNDID
mmetsp:Transcript_11659/g.21861  ORF Transcript_11659/g.21861 Transcript_11659/m.21861 type:complete len:142 (+) Transcript_11659:217-642(+)